MRTLLTFVIFSVALLAQTPATGGPASAANRFIRSNNLPSTCIVGAVDYNIGDSTFYKCATTNTWTAIGAGGGSVTSVSGPGYLTWANSTTTPTATSTLFATNAKTSTYQVLAADFTACKTIPVASGTFTITLVASGAQPASGQCIKVINYGSGVVTIARSGQNINGGTASLTLPAAASATAPTQVDIVSDGTNYFASVESGCPGSAATSTQVLAGNTCAGSDQFTLDLTTIGPANYQGSTLNDLTSGGTYTGLATTPGGAIFDVRIDATGTPDTFRWRKNTGSFTNGVAITGAAQTLSNGVTVTFAATTGHTNGDQWIVPIEVNLNIDPPNLSGYNAGYAGAIKFFGNRVLNVFDSSGNYSNIFLGPNSGNITMGPNAGNNTCTGAYCLASLTAGTNNSGTAQRSLVSLTIGSQNVADGQNSCANLVVGDGNTCIGQGAGNSMLGSGGLFLGYSAGYHETASNTFYVDAIFRADSAAEKAGALLYGTFNATPASQTLVANAAFSTLVSTTNPRYNTTTNCADSAGAAACGSAAAGAFVIDAGATATVVSTTAVTANSEVFVQFDSSLGARLGITCNVAVNTAAIGSVTARTAGTSFTYTITGTLAVNPGCFTYHIVN